MEGVLGEDAAAILPRLALSDADLDDRAECQYNESMQLFVAQLAAVRKPRRRRSNDYKRRNCEEASGGWRG